MPTPNIRTTVSLLVGCLLASCAAMRSPDSTVPVGQLPGTVSPRHYDLALTIDPRDERFQGEVTITVDLQRATTTLWMHGDGIEPSSVSVLFDGQTYDAAWHPEADGVAAVRLADRIGPGEASVRITYTAPFDERLRGLYRVTVDERAYAFTQFEPLDARKAFPSFDEPAFKTPFDVSLTVPADHVAIANTPARETERIGDGFVRTRFETTVPLPTYLVAFAVGPFDVVEAADIPAGDRNRAPVPLRGVAVNGRGEELAYALEHTPAILQAFEGWFDSPFPYPKLDIIAVPDFGSGAMENAGAITFRDSLLLFDGSMSTRNRRLFTYVMAHELAHTWFGNTVTMPWWNDIWLNEAFATWHGNRIVTIVAPEQHADLALLDRVHGAMGIDGRASTRAIRQPIESNHDVHNAFDPITYSKGAGVLAMFERWTGREDFRTGVQTHIETHRDGNATTEDLLAALSEASGRDVTAAFETFLTQPGVPLVTAEVKCDETGARVALRQERFVPLGSKASRDARWKIPICLLVGFADARQEVCGLLSNETDEIEIPGDRCPSWLMPNAGATGYYRFTQPGDGTRALMTSGFETLSPAERSSVANNLDASFRAGAGLAPTFTALPILAQDPNRNTAQAPTGLLWLAHEHLVAEEQKGILRRFTAEMYGPRLAGLGWDPQPGEDGETALLRRTAISSLGSMAREPAVRAELLRRARRYAALDGGEPDGDALAPDLVDVGLIVAIEEGGSPAFDAIETQLHESDHALERGHRLNALGAAKDPVLIARARALALDERLRVNETTRTLWPLMMRADTQEETWGFIEENFDALVARSGEGGAGKLPWLVSGLCSDELIDRAETFLEPRAADLPGGPRNLAGAIEAARQCAALKAEYADELAAFLAERSTRSPAPGAH